MSRSVVRLATAALVVVLSALTSMLAVASERRSSNGTSLFERELGKAGTAVLERYQVPSAAVAVVDGTAVRASLLGRPLYTNVFHVASLSKTATALAVLSLAEQGRLELDAPINRYLHRWKVPSSPFDASAVTARRVLSHTAGFPVSGRIVRPLAPSYPPVEQILEGHHGWLPARLTYAPGTQFAYSNPGYEVLELLVEEVTHKSFPDAMGQLVFGPLHMTHSGYDEDVPNVLGFWRTGRPSPPQRLVPRAAGGLLTTADDVGRLLMATWRPRGEGGLLASAWLQQMRTVAKPAVGAFGLGKEGGYALGIATLKLPSGRIAVLNNGSFIGYNAVLVGVPALRSGFVMLTNSDSGLGAELELSVPWFDKVAGERPAALARFVTFRSRVRWATIAALVIVGLFLANVVRGVWRQRRRWPGEIGLRKLVLKTFPLILIGVTLFVVFNTGWTTRDAAAVAPARFVSGDYRWLIASLCASLIAIGLAAVATPKQSGVGARES